MKQFLTCFAIVILLGLSCTPEKREVRWSAPHTEKGWIKDEANRVMLLRGANYMGMEFGWFNHSRTDFELMKSWGFNTIRLPISWDYLEPMPGVYDFTYLWYVDRVIEWCRELGLFIILDMHQWQWSPCFEGNGAPEWTCDQYEKNEMFIAAADFWRDEELKQHFIDTWTKVAERYSGEKTIIAYDLFNEPNPGVLFSVDGSFEKNYLMPFYRELIDAIRSVDTGHILFIEPAITHGFNPGFLEKMESPNLVYSVHIYTGGTWDGITGYDGNISKLEDEIMRSYEEAGELNMPLVIGEFGVGSAATRAMEWVRDEFILLDKYILGSTYWTFWRDDSSFGLLDAQGNPKEGIINVLMRPYPVYTAGIPKKLAFDLERKEFSLIFEEESNAEDPTVIFLPAKRHYPDGFNITLSDGSYEWDKNSEVINFYRDRSIDKHEIIITAK